MNLFLLVREALGINQESLAQLLNVNLSMLKMAETNRRNLPLPAWQRLEWMASLVQNLPVSDEAMEFQTEAVSDLLLKTRKKKREADSLVQSIDTKRSQMKNRLAFQPAFSAQFPAETHPSEALRMNALVFNAQTFLKYEDTENELLLRVRQAGLAAMIAFLEKAE